MTQREELFAALHKHVAQRTGMDYRNYGDWKAFRSEYNEVLRDGKDARTMLTLIALKPHVFPLELLLEDLSGHGRLSFEGGDIRYCTGQYWPTEYRSAVCRYLRDTYVRGMRAQGYSYEEVKKIAGREFGRGIRNRWFF